MQSERLPFACISRVVDWTTAIGSHTPAQLASASLYFEQSKVCNQKYHTFGNPISVDYAGFHKSFGHQNRSLANKSDQKMLIVLYRPLNAFGLRKSPVLDRVRTLQSHTVHTVRQMIHCQSYNARAILAELDC